MSKILSDYITKHREEIGDNMPVPEIVCKDGLRMSVQAHHGAYSTPRENKGPWAKFEVGFPSERVEELMPFAEDAERPTETVYGYVPGEIIEAVIAKHGGIAD